MLVITVGKSVKFKHNKKHYLLLASRLTPKEAFVYDVTTEMFDAANKTAKLKGAHLQVIGKNMESIYERFEKGNVKIIDMKPKHNTAKTTVQLPKQKSKE